MDGDIPRSPDAQLFEDGPSSYVARAEMFSECFTGFYVSPGRVNQVFFS